MTDLTAQPNQPDPYQEKIDGLIGGLREFANWLDEHRHDGLELPAYPDMLWSTQFAGDGEAAVVDIAGALGVEVDIDQAGHHNADRLFGAGPEHGFQVHAYHIPEKKPVDRVAGDPR